MERPTIQQINSKQHRTVFVSDTHGYLDEMIQVLAEAGLVDDQGNWICGESASLVHLGDFVDRGPKNVETYQYVRNLQDQIGQRQVKMLVGNHDLQYMVPSLDCGIGPGETRAGKEEIRSALASRMKADVRSGRLQFACAFKDDGKDWLCTHGGLDPRWDHLNKMSSSAATDHLNRIGRECVLEGAWHLEILGVDEHRVSPDMRIAGQFDPIPGITWADVKFNLSPNEDDLGHNQIVGHRPQHEVNLSDGGKIWAVNVPYGDAQLLVHDTGQGFRPGIRLEKGQLVEWPGFARSIGEADAGIDLSSSPHL